MIIYLLFINLKFGFDDSGEPWLLKPTVGNSQVNQVSSKRVSGCTLYSLESEVVG